MKSGAASGIQIAFFTFAILLLAVPVSNWLVATHPWSSEVAAMLRKAMPFAIGGALLLFFRATRRSCADALAVGIPREKRLETALVVAAQIPLPFAWAGAVVIWHWMIGGEAGLAQRMRMLPSHDIEMSRAFLGAEMVRIFVIAGIVAPVVEEIVFRHMLYRAWERTLGWVPAMLASSALFAAYHPNFAPAFVTGVLMVCILRRTGSIWGPILAHSALNMLSWYPLLGMHVFPRELLAPGDLVAWSFQLACLFIALIALPAYVWIARHEQGTEPPTPAIPNGALPQ